ncbi:MAG: uncharacterized protein PWQ88_528 [Candidatus Methanomethylophilaceae archaeon]|nr:uncharacterized protein [Candidatus Methanomethylophilaceae archaeon]
MSFLNCFRICIHMEEMECGSLLRGTLPHGCQHCREGGKLVLFISGRCQGGCYYCPLSEVKKGNDLIFANEARVESKEDIIREARQIGATGTGITGGDPLLCAERTEKAIATLKKEFGVAHHIHLYTCSVNIDKLRRLEDAGLDEIRFHPPLEMWTRMDELPFRRLISRTGMSVGLELPALPDRERELRKALAFAAEAGMDFVNLNELEFSEGNYSMMKRFGYQIKDDLSSAVEGSEELARRLLMESRGINVHYCSSAFKDSVQLRRRLLRRAERVAKGCDEITEDGTLLKGVIECDEPQKVMQWLCEEFEIPLEFMNLDSEKERLEIAPWILEEIYDEVPFRSYIVEEYPTADRLEVERTPLR